MVKANKRIGVLGGTFSPIHNGHIFLAEYVQKHCGLEKVLLIPARIPPHKLAEDIVEADHRLAMTRLAARHNPLLQVSDMEIKRPQISYTYDTLMCLKEQLGPAYDLFFITGTDELLGLDRWYKAKELLAQFGFIVGVRPGYEVEKIQDKIDFLQAEYGAKIEIISLPAPDISASDVRARLEGRKLVEGLLDDAVIAYIQDKGLYR